MHFDEQFWISGQRCCEGNQCLFSFVKFTIERNAKHERCRSEEDCGLPAHWHIFQQLALGPTYWSGSKLSSRENLPQRRLEVVGIGV